MPRDEGASQSGIAPERYVSGEETRFVAGLSHAIGYMHGLADGFEFWSPTDRTKTAEAIRERADAINELMP